MGCQDPIDTPASPGKVLSAPPALLDGNKVDERATSLKPGQ
jgi:hypothetical protein